MPGIQTRADRAASVAESEAQLAEIIATHRGLFGGFTMTAPAVEPVTPTAPVAPVVTPPVAPVTPVVTPIAPAVTPAPAASAETPEQTIARLTTELTAARGEAGKTRVNAKQAAADEARTELAQQIGKALGLVKDDTPVDPAKLTADLAAVGTENATLKTQNAALLAAVTLGANPVALLDSNSFLKSLEGLAPTDSEKITAAINAAITSNPALKTTAPAAPVVPKSGPEITGGPGGPSKPTTLEDAIAAKLAAAK